MSSSAVQRRGPSTGYLFGSKQHYRNMVWKRFREHCRGHVSEAHALLMPSIEGKEIDVAMQHGFREQNLHIVDDNPAIVATLKRRYPRINTYGVDLKDAIRRMAKDRVCLRFANFDLCSNICGAWQTLGHAGWPLRAVLDPSGLVAITMLRGRETIGIKNLPGDAAEFRAATEDDRILLQFFNGFFPSLSLRDAWRLFRAGEALTRGMAASSRAAGETTTIVALPKHERDANIYRRGSQTMLWAIFELSAVPLVQ